MKLSQAKAKKYVPKLAEKLKEQKRITNFVHNKKNNYIFLEF